MVYKISNFPNPFNPLTKIEFQLPKENQVTIKIFDTIGKEIITLVNDRLNEGTYYINFDGSKLPSGVYICSFKANNFIQNQKMLLVK